MRRDNRSKGLAAEDQAAEYILKKGYSILERNFRTPAGEIDIIAKDRKGIICFIEVKYRESLGFGRPAESVTPAKQKKISRTAEYYIKRNKLQGRAARFDIVEVYPEKIEIIKDAFMSGSILL